MRAALGKSCSQQRWTPYLRVVRRFVRGWRVEKRGKEDVVDGQAPLARLGARLPQVTQRARPDRDSVLSTTSIAQCSRDRDLLLYRPFSLRYMGGSIAFVKLLSSIVAPWPLWHCNTPLRVWFREQW